MGQPKRCGTASVGRAFMDLRARQPQGVDRRRRLLFFSSRLTSGALEADALRRSLGVRNIQRLNP